MNKFSEYLERQFLEWQQKSGKRRTLNDFADYLGVKRPLLSLWLNGSRKPGIETTIRLSELLGLEIYDALELPRPDPRLHYITRNWGKIPDEEKNRIAEGVQKYTTEQAPNDEGNSTTDSGRVE